MRKHPASKRCCGSPLTEPPPADDDAELLALAGAAQARRRARLGRSLAIRAGRRRLLQRLRAGDSRAEQRLLRPGAVRPAIRRLAAPCRRAAGDRPGDQNMREALERTYAATPDAEMGGRGRRLRPRRRRVSPAATPARAAYRTSFRSICIFRAARRRQSR